MGGGFLKSEGGPQLGPRIIDVVYFSESCPWLRHDIITGIKSASELLVQPKKLLESN